MSKARKGININCKACNKEFYVAQGRIATAKFCSVQCLNHTQYESIFKNCGTCNKEFEVSQSRKDRTFCSQLCKNVDAKNEKELRLRIKALGILKRGRNSSRDLKKYISRTRELYCDNCGYNKSSYNIEIHHIDENPNNNTIENLAVLCVMCHRDVHYGKLRFNGKNYYEEK